MMAHPRPDEEWKMGLTADAGESYDGDSEEVTSL